MSTAGKYKIDYRRQLNPAQYEAVMHGQGPLLVIAGAGSGKTRTLTYRVARLVEDGIAASSILLLSFTRKASREMLARAASLLDRRCREVGGGTFHSFANSVLRCWKDRIGFAEGFTIIDRADSEDLIGMVSKTHSAAAKAKLKRLPRKSTLATIFSRAINKHVDLEDVVCREYPQFVNLLDEILSIHHEYREQKRIHRLVDYDDLLTLLLKLLRECPDVRREIVTTYRHVMVDEYQDTNYIQSRLITLMANPENNIMVVGDDAQSIYAFRGANFKNIISFPERFPGTRIIKLEENYRSIQPILDLTNRIIEQAEEKFSKRLFTRRKGGRLPQLVATADEHLQSMFVASEIARLQRRGVALSDVAVLFRAGFHAFDLEMELTRRNLPFVKYGGFKFMESAHIKDLLAHLRIVASANDRLSWYRALNLVDRVGPATAEKLFRAVSRDGIQALEGACKKLPSLGGLTEALAAMQADGLAPAKIGEIALRHYLPILRQRFDDHPKRLRDLEQLLTIMERYDRLEDFLDDMVLEPPASSVNNQLAPEDHRGDNLVLSTIHSAKGLEWHTVFIIWALDGRFPSFHSLDSGDSLEEERRLMYVAATRARENLIITFPAQVYDRSSGTVLYRPCRFLEPIAENYLERRYIERADQI